MAKSIWMTPEEIERTKKRNKLILMIAVPAVTILLSASLTLLMH
ncbi:hypothetical protein [uncultured Metabacillus sp.]|nr:hypothetical protein [uncultured Metabacillus sp.]